MQDQIQGDNSCNIVAKSVAIQLKYATYPEYNHPFRIGLFHASTHISY